MKTYKECEIMVDILGTMYSVIICPESRDKRFEDLNCGGFCDYSAKKLYISNFLETKEKDVSIENVPYIIEKAIKHEMVHAFMYESGLGEDWEHKPFGQEETTVDWIARQLDKIYIKAKDVLHELEKYATEV